MTNWARLRTLTLTTGLVIVGIGVIFMLIGTFYNISNFIEAAKWVLSMGLGITSLGIAFHSIVISEESRKIAGESDGKMKALANADFFELTYRFWEKAPKLYYPLDFPSRDTCSWHLVNYFNHADKLKKWADSDVQEKLINALKIFLERLRPKTCKKFWVEIKNYMGACNIALGFKADEDVKNELIDELANWIGKKQEGESNQKYLQRKSNELSKMKKSDIFEITG